MDTPSNPGSTVPPSGPRWRRSLARGLMAATAGMATLTVPLGTPALTPVATAVPGVPTTTFDPNVTSWYSFRDQSSTAYAATFAEKSSQGFLPTDLDVSTDGGYRVGSVWQKNADRRGWKAKRDLTSSQFTTEWNAAKAAGMRLVEQESYVVDGTRRYAGIWIANVEQLRWASHRDQTDSQFKASFAANKAAGLMPIDYDEHRTSAGLRFDSVWVNAPAGSTWYLYRGLSSSAYSAKFDQLKGSHRVLTTDSMLDGSSQRYAGIWLSNTNGRRWAERRDLTATAYAEHWHRYEDLGYRVVSFNRYTTANGVRYAAVWRQNSD